MTRLIDSSLEKLSTIMSDMGEMAIQCISLATDSYLQGSSNCDNARGSKWWKTPVTFDTDHAKEELIDIWHFVVQASLELGLKPKDILEEYQRKNTINHKRQREGY